MGRRDSIFTKELGRNAHLGHHPLPKPADFGKSAAGVKRKQVSAPEHERDVPAPCERNCAGSFPVGHDETCEILRLFVSAMAANVAAARGRPLPDVSGTIAPKLVRALQYLSQQDGVATKVGDLAEGLQVSLGWASRVADELASFGFLKRVRNEHDRRIVRLELTEKAAEIGRRLLSDREATIVAALADLGPGERHAIANFLRRLGAE